MNRNNIIGLLLIAAILIGYSVWFTPDAGQPTDGVATHDTLAIDAPGVETHQPTSDDIVDTEDLADSRLTDQKIADSPDEQGLIKNMGFFTASASGQKEFFTVKNEVVELTISSKGGHIHSTRLKEFKTFEKEPLVLFTGNDDQFFMAFTSNNGDIIKTNDLYFKPYLNNEPYKGEQEIKLSSDDPLVFSMRAYSDMHDAANPSYIELAYTLSQNEYMIDFDIYFTGTQNAIDANLPSIITEWHAKLLRQEKNRQNEQNNTTLYYKYINEKPSRIRPGRDGNETHTDPLRWISYKQQFFSTTLISLDGFASAHVTTTALPDIEENYLKYMTSSIQMQYEPHADNHYALQWYFGPNNFRKLRAYDLQLERQIPLGWGFFLMSWINRYAVIPIFNFLDGFDLNYGIIILILTILLKIVLLPIAYKTYISQAKMRLLKPDIEDLGKKFPKKEDAMKKQQATMALYKKAGVNPMAGCIPMLLQLPILLALFRFFPASIELRQQSFLWADDLSSYDSILNLPFVIPLYGDHVSLFTLLMAGSMVLYTHLNSQMMSTGNQMPGMKMMMYLMPVMLLGIFNSFASGLSYYYFLANVITFGQMFIFKKMIDEDALRAKIEENKKKPVKKSKWQKRMEELAKQQEAQKKRRKR